MEPYPSALVDSTPFGRHWARVSLGRRYRARAFGHLEPVVGGWAERWWVRACGREGERMAFIQIDDKNFRLDLHLCVCMYEFVFIYFIFCFL